MDGDRPLKLSVLSFRKKEEKKRRREEKKRREEEKKRREEEKKRREENPKTQAHAGRKLSAIRYQRPGSRDLKIRHPPRPGAPGVKVISFQ